jgi:hypothetical protein
MAVLGVEMISFLKRILNYDEYDWKHLLWLCGRVLNGYWNGNLDQMMDACFWIKVHLLFDSEREYPPKIKKI